MASLAVAPSPKHHPLFLQAAFTHLGLALLLLLTTWTVETAIWQTYGLVFVVWFGSFILVRKAAYRLHDLRIQYLHTFFMLKILLMILLLHLGWLPNLHLNADIFGYDPQRYYFQANDLAEQNFQLNEQFTLNYTGILYYYGFIFKLLGFNPLIPALVNAFVTLIAALFLLELGYSLVPEPTPYHWTLGLFFFIPEVIWFDAITSRETIVMSLIVCIILLSRRYYLASLSQRNAQFSLVLMLALMLMLGLIRTPMMIAVQVAVVGLFFVTRMYPLGRFLSLILIAMTTGIVLLAPQIASELGSYGSDYSESFSQLALRNEFFATPQFQWRERSVGLLFIADTIPEAILFAPTRLLIYVAQPLPNIPINPGSMQRGEYGSWQYLMVIFSSLLYLGLFPFGLAATLHSLRQRTWLVFTLPMWVLMVVISSGTQIVSDRYRVMAVPFIWASIWLGFFSPRRTVTGMYIVWLFVLISSAILFTVYRFN